MDMEQQMGSKSGKEYIKVVYCHHAYLTYMQNTSCKMLGSMKHNLESRLLGGLMKKKKKRLPGEISVTSDKQMTLRLWQKAKN